MPVVSLHRLSSPSVNRKVLTLKHHSFSVMIAYSSDRACRLGSSLARSSKAWSILSLPDAFYLIVANCSLPRFPPSTQLSHQAVLNPSKGSRQPQEPQLLGRSVVTREDNLIPDGFFLADAAFPLVSCSGARPRSIEPCLKSLRMAAIKHLRAHWSSIIEMFMQTYLPQVRTATSCIREGK